MRVAALVGILLIALSSHVAAVSNIQIAYIGPLTGPEASQGHAYAAGLKLYFDSVNRAGGVNGVTVSLVEEDDGGRPDDTIALARKSAANPNVIALTGLNGNRNVRELIATGVLEAAGIPLVGYRSAELLPRAPLVYNVRASLNEEVAKIVQHVSTIGLHRLGLFYEDSPVAPQGPAIIDKLAAQSGANVVVRASYPAGTARVTPAVETFIRAHPQAIIMICNGAAAAGFIEQYKQSNGTAQLFATSSVDIEQLSTRLSIDQMQGIAIAQVTPSPYNIGSRLVKEFSDLARSQHLTQPVSYAMLEGFIAAKVLTHALHESRAPSRKSLVTALDAIDRLDLGGYVISYRQGSKSGSRRVELSIVSATGRIRQ